MKSSNELLDVMKEIEAYYVLDFMPGNQMAIDAGLNSMNISSYEAEEQRLALNKIKEVIELTSRRCEDNVGSDDDIQAVQILQEEITRELIEIFGRFISFFRQTIMPSILDNLYTNEKSEKRMLCKKNACSEVEKWLRSQIYVINNRIYDFIYNMAVNDATNLGPKTVEHQKTDLLGCKGERIKTKVKTYAEMVINGRGTDESFYETIDEILHIAQKDLQYKKDVFSFGKAQKLINMTMKYLYIAYYDDPDVTKHFEVCHAPMDSIMRDLVFDIYTNEFDAEPFSKNCSWSALKDRHQSYDAFQKAIKEIIKASGKSISRIQFDYCLWEMGKERKRIREGKEDKDRKKELLDENLKSYKEKLEFI